MKDVDPSLYRALHLRMKVKIDSDWLQENYTDRERKEYLVRLAQILLNQDAIATVEIGEIV